MNADARRRPTGPGRRPPPGHGAVLEIDLDAVAANYRLLRARAQGAEVAATVKADAYGLGLSEVAPVLAAAGARRFCVATPQEGARLRGLLPDADIIVLNGYRRDARELFDAHALAAALNSLAEVEAWVADMPPDHPVALHVDTGMSRLGMSAADMAALLAAPALAARCCAVGILSHLACADDADHPMNADQRTRFAGLIDRLDPALGPSPAGKRWASLAGSSGIFLGPAYHFDLVRPGAALYGLTPFSAGPDAPANPMHQVVHLYAQILQTRVVDRPMTVGYGAVHKVPGKRKIATISAGYADGYPRSAGQAGPDDHRYISPESKPVGRAYLAGTTVPIVGRVSMDLITLDVTEIPPDAVAPGTFVELLGAHIGADDVAYAAGTIGYEILTGLGRRAWRVYRTDRAEGPAR